MSQAGTTLAEIAKTEESRFQWWVWKTFHILPTESRWLDLTEEQLDLMYQHWLIDTEPFRNANKKAAVDPDFDEELAKEGLLPPEGEKFNDPDFDKEWDALEEPSESPISNKNIIGEKPISGEVLGETPTPSALDKSRWEEVD